MQTHAALTGYNANGIELVHSSVSSVTWTKDADLLGTMIANSSDADGNGTNDTIDDIIKATYDAVPSYLLPVLKPQIDLYVNPSTFNSVLTSGEGRTTWWGANAFISYLNSINYAGSALWKLPTVILSQSRFIQPFNGVSEGGELSELFYQELNGAAGTSVTQPTKFNNLQSYGYWSGTEFQITSGAWYFNMASGFHDRLGKGIELYAWAINSALVAPVPEPDNSLMIMLGLGMVALVTRRKLV